MSASSFDHSQMSRQLANLHDALIGAGQLGDARNLVKDESRRLLQQILKFTPPKNNPQGRSAVSRDIQRSMIPLKPDFENPKINKLIQDNNVEGLRKFFSRLPGLKSFRIVEFDPRIHKMNRDRRGRVTSSKRNYTLEIAKLSKYIREVQKRVGFMRAPWAKAFVAVGGKVSGWMSRHFGYSRGYVLADLTHPTFPSITVRNQTPGVGQWEKNVNDAIRSRQVSIGRRIKLLINGYGKQAKSGTKITAKVKQTAETSLVE